MPFIAFCRRAADGGRASAGVEAHRARHCHREARTVRKTPSFFSTFPTVLCLSRACRGKIMASIYTYILLKKGVFARAVCLVFPCARPEPVVTTRISGFMGHSNEANARCSSHCCSYRGAPVTALRYSPSGDLLAVGHRDCCIELFDVRGDYTRLAALNGPSLSRPKASTARTHAHVACSSSLQL
eukprot:COSAG06_NODE_9211_length_1957_cov_96.872982_2_plen_185_part_00